MTIERFILIAVSVISVASFFYIPKDKIRLALISFTVINATSWSAVLYLTQKGALEYPVREFVIATRANFIPQFLFFPTVAAWFILLYPKDSGFIRKVIHYFIFVSIPIWFIYFIATYTDLENFLKGSGKSQVFRMYKSFLFQFALTHLYVKWFTKKRKL
ncbi:MAG: hypothetical protein N2645_23200 [Clostridia bacterium]|nr:hypothetical protein [Clostridia bacterium]